MKKPNPKEVDPNQLKNLEKDDEQKKPIKKNDKFSFNNNDLKTWLSSNYPKSIIFEFERGNLPYYIFETYLKSIN